MEGVALSTVPEVLRPEYYFDLDLMEYRELFDGVGCVWEVVKKMQDSDIIDQITRTRCAAVADAGESPHSLPTHGCASTHPVRGSRGAARTSARNPRIF